MKNKKILALAGRLEEEDVRKLTDAASSTVSDAGKNEIIQDLSADLWKLETQKKANVPSQKN